MIEIIGTELYQWDHGRSVKVTETEASNVHFANQGDAKAVKMELVNSQALIPDYLFQTGKQLCVFAVANGVTIESKMFSVKKRPRPEDYVYDDDQRNYIYELISDAENVVECATTATQNANEAANKALKAASSWVMVGEASGESVAFDDAVSQSFAGFRIFGKTSQDGTPTPESPVELVNVGDSGSITVNVTGPSETQSMTFSTPNGLPGIPVTSGGNYTDANGQQWICDEIDFARGVYVQRCKEIVIDGTTAVRLNKHANSQCLCAQAVPDILITSPPNIPKLVMSDRYEADSWTDQNNRVYCIGEDIIITDNRFTNMDATIAVLREEKPKVVYILATPIETPLSEEELAAYAALHTYKGHTTVINDAGAYMELEYVMDAKKYIDSLVGTGGSSSGTILPATVE